MTRRFDETYLAVPEAATPVMPDLLACSVAAVPMSLQQMWQAIYQTALTQAVMKAMIDSQPTKYQRLVLQVCLN
jgi:hypothetical protein